MTSDRVTRVKSSALLLALLLSPARVRAQPAQSARGPAERTPLNLPISVEKIREALARPVPRWRLRGFTTAGAPTFHVHVTEQFTRLFPPIDHPRVQPYGAFSTAEVLTLGAEALIEKYIAATMADALDAALQERAEREARDDVARARAAAAAAN